MPPIDHSQHGRHADPGLLAALGHSARIALLRGRETRVPYWPREAIDARRDRRLRRIVKHAFENVPYYQRAMAKRGARPEDIRTLEDMAALPIPGDEDMRRDPEQFLSRRVRPEQCYVFTTGGSTGVNKRVHYDPGSLFQRYAMNARQQAVVDHWMGGRPARRILSISIASSNTRRVWMAYRRALFTSFRRGPEWRTLESHMPLEEQVAAVNEFKPDIVRGYPGSVGCLYAEARRRGLELWRPSLISGGGEAMPVAHRRVIEEEYGIPVALNYASMETLSLAFECEARDGYHIHEDLSPIRIVDEEGRPLPPGVPGRVIVSNLYNRGAVLLNFDLNDRGLLIEEPCACGRTLRRIRLLEGRPGCLVDLPDGRRMNYMEVNAFTRGHKEVEVMQLIVVRPDHWRLGVLSAAPDATRQWLDGACRQIEAELAGGAVRIEGCLMEKPELSPTGKILPLIVKRGEEAR